jgi:predicted nucleotidyltransferase
MNGSMTDSIKKIINKKSSELGYTVKSISLFGSRAANKSIPGSDWDVLVIIENNLNFTEKWDYITAIQREFAPLRISIDIIVQSVKEVETNAVDRGNICYYALKNGIAI